MTSPIVTPRQRFFTADGAPLSLGFLYAYAAGTTTPLATYQDAAGAVPNQHPIPLDSSGECVVFLGDAGAYDFELKNSALVTQPAPGLSVQSMSRIVATTDAALRADLANTASAVKGASLIGYDYSRAYASGTAGKKLHQYLHVEDFGAVGAVTSEATQIASALAQAIATGRQLHFDGTKTYVVDVSSWEIPIGARLVTNGCLFKLPTTITNDTVWLTVRAGAVIDEINVTIPTSVRRDCCVVIEGNDTRIGKVAVTSVDQQLTTGANDHAVKVQSGARMWVGLIKVINYNRAVIISGTTNSVVARIEIENYIRGLYAFDNKNLLLSGGRIKTLSPSAGDPAAGENGILLGCTVDGAQASVTIADFHISDSNEHGIRIGGPEAHNGVSIVRPVIHNTGGCGIKVLGTDGGSPTDRNKNIRISHANIYDVGEKATGHTTSALNRNGILAQYVTGLVIESPIIKSELNATSAPYGIRVDACSMVQISNAFVTDTEFDGIAVWAYTESCDNVLVSGCSTIACARTGFSSFIEPGYTLLNVSVEALRSVGNAYGVVVANSGGTVSNCVVRATLANNTTLQVSANASSLATYDIIGAGPLATNALDGSTWRDGATLNYRKAGAWVAL